MEHPKTKWRFFLDYPSAWEAMLAACESATTSIDLEQFIIRTDEIGLKFLSVLQKKAKAGVTVRIIADAAGSIGLYGSLIPIELRSHGIKIAFFNTPATAIRTARPSVFLRDHRKLLIIDKKRAYTGGICLTEEMAQWRDTLAEISGPVVEEMQAAFDNMWERAWRGKLRIFRKKISKDKWHDGMQYLTSTPFPGERELYHAVIDAIRFAKRYIYITTPYFVPDPRLLRVLRLAVSRGVSVKILLPKASDHKIVDLAGQSHFEKLLKNGIEIYRYNHTMIHSKTICIDTEWATLGSLNLDYVSLWYNYEANLVSSNRDFVEEIRQQFLDDVGKAEFLTHDTWKKRSNLRKFLEFLVRPIRWML